MIVAIDGPAASGKSTVARRVAQRLGFRYLDTGAMYRAIGVETLHRGVALDDVEGIIAVARSCRVTFDHLPGEAVYTAVRINGRDVTADIRTPEADLAVSPVSQIAEVRELMVAEQRRLASEADTVVEGRDIGTVVFPDAPVKVYLTATASERARRRLGDRVAAGHGSEIAAVAADIERRDRADAEREVSPLRPAEDALVIDTTEMSPDEVVDTIISLVRAVER
ncbi:MAG: (d)CMP kinase [Coriobacteriales bacterium]|nr:(d)CMP kinase [Actinomycetes bacterium]